MANDEAVERSRKIPATFTEAERSVVMRAIEWRLAQSAVTTGTTPELSGTALTEICREWIAGIAGAAIKAMRGD